MAKRRKACGADHPQVMEFHSDFYGTRCRRMTGHKGKHRGESFSVDTGLGQANTGKAVAEWADEAPQEHDGETGRQPCGCGVGWQGKGADGQAVCAAPVCPWRCVACRKAWAAPTSDLCKTCRERGGVKSDPPRGAVFLGPHGVRHIFLGYTETDGGEVVARVVPDDACWIMRDTFLELWTRVE